MTALDGALHARKIFQLESLSLGAADAFLGVEGRVRRCLAELEFVMDHTPVLAGPGAYLAKLEHDSRKVILNAYFIESAERPEIARHFLMYHEAFHAFGQEAPDELGRLTASLEKEEERLADEFALFALEKWGYAT